MAGHAVSRIPGFDDWSYGEFRQGREGKTITVPIVRDDGETVEFTVPAFVENPEDLREIARVVIDALGKWNSVQGLGA